VEGENIEANIKITKERYKEAKINLRKKQGRNEQGKK
jgi:hypothetical protein